MDNQIMLIYPGKSIYEQNEIALTSLLTLFFAENEPEEAKIGIIWCVRNRLISQKKKDIISNLVALGISVTSDNGLYNKSVLNLYGSELWDKTFILCRDILNGTSQNKDITNGSDIFFLTKEKLPHWIKDIFFKIQYGNVRFYKLEMPKK